MTAEHDRLARERAREENWKRWGPYLPERQWGTVREDYSGDGDAWNHFPFEHAHMRTYRWGEDGLLGWCDRQCRIAFAPALWNEHDPILKERLFGLTNAQGNHGEDVKEQYHYLDSTPTHSYARALYRYPQDPFPYDELREENNRRGRNEPEFEIDDTGVFAGDRVCELEVAYAKASPNDTLIRLRIRNTGPEAAAIHLLPTVWFRNTWTWGCRHEGCTMRPSARLEGEGPDSAVHLRYPDLPEFRFQVDRGDFDFVDWLFTENETNHQALYGNENPVPFVKDAFHRRVVRGDEDAVNRENQGTKAAAWMHAVIEPGNTVEMRARLYSPDERGTDAGSWTDDFDAIFQRRSDECAAFHDKLHAAAASDEDRAVARSAWAGLLWSKQFYHYSVPDWIEGDPDVAEPPSDRGRIRNGDWEHLFNRDVISMPDKWEYPWYASWDLAFHMIPMARIDPDYAKEQLILFLREWYLHPNGQMPAYEWNLSDVNPPVHAWACWRVYKMTGTPGNRDRAFLRRVFLKLLLNFTWWVNRKDPHGRNIFSGGFLGLDNIGLFDRSHPLPGNVHLEQADATAWMAFYCGTMLSMALELAPESVAFEDIASKFFEHFVSIVDAVNDLGGCGLWDDEAGFYYDQVAIDGQPQRMPVRSMVGLLPLIAVEIIESSQLEGLPRFRKRMDWFLEHRRDLASQISYMECDGGGSRYILAIPSRDRLQRVLRYLLDENEFLSPYGIRSLSRHHRDHPVEMDILGENRRIAYVPGESDSGLFGGNSNWRGPVWFPVNYLLIEALERYHHFYGDDLSVDYPTGSGNQADLGSVARDLSRRLCDLFRANDDGAIPALGRESGSPAHLLFHEYFHGDDGHGLGASHQTGWTALVANLLEHARR